MSQQVIINCGEGDSRYQVILTGKDPGVFEKAKSDPDIAGKEGEALVAAIIDAGGISAVMRYKNGKHCDGANNEPGLLKFNDNGTLLALRHFKDGKLQDAPNGELAVLQFDHFSNNLVYAASFQEGKRVKKLTQTEIGNYLMQIHRGEAASNKLLLPLLLPRTGLTARPKF